MTYQVVHTCLGLKTTHITDLTAPRMFLVPYQLIYHGYKNSRFGHSSKVSISTLTTKTNKFPECSLIPRSQVHLQTLQSLQQVFSSIMTQKPSQPSLSTDQKKINNIKTKSKRTLDTDLDYLRAQYDALLNDSSQDIGLRKEKNTLFRKVPRYCSVIGRKSSQGRSKPVLGSARMTEQGEKRSAPAAFSSPEGKKVRADSCEVEIPTTVKTTFLLVSDTHGLVPKNEEEEQGNRIFTTPLPKADVFIHAGDMTNDGSLNELEKTVAWIRQVPAEIKILIAGNHDTLLDYDLLLRLGVDSTSSDDLDDSSDSADSADDSDGSGEDEETRKIQTKKFQEYLKAKGLFDQNIFYLDNETRQFTLTNGAKFTVLASPYTPYGPHPHDKGSFRYTADLQGNFWRTELMYTKLPEDGVDVLLIHGPPYGILDQTRKGKNVGCRQLREYIQDLKPSLSVCGHIHEAAGARQIKWPKSQLTSDAEWEKVIEPVTDRLMYGMGDGGSLLSYRRIGPVDPAKKGERTIFINASIAGHGSNPGAMNCPALFTMDLPYDPESQRNPLDE